jgi:basic membrane protein A
VILKALAKDPDERYQTAEDMVEALKRAIPEGTRAAAKPGPRSAPKPTGDRAAPYPTLGALPDRQVIAQPAPRRRVPGWVWALIVVGVVLIGLLATGGALLASRSGELLASIPGLIPAQTTPGVVPPTSMPTAGTPMSSGPSAGLTPTAEPLPRIKVGVVTNVRGVNDRSFNSLTWEGVQEALTQLGVDGTYLESSQPSDYARNIQRFVAGNTDLIVTVGFPMGIDTAAAAKANPDSRFAIVDYTFPDCSPGAAEGRDCGSATELANVRGLLFQTDQASFLAGYLAAGMSKTGKVGTFGGMKIPQVTKFMKGFQAGIQYYNQVNGTDVELIGWDEGTQRGLFSGDFASTNNGYSLAATLVHDGADIVFPVAGDAGLGSAAYCMDSGKCLIIGVDSDWFDVAPQYRGVELSSVMKRADVAVFETIRDFVDGTFTGGAVIYTIANGGVDLAPFHDLDSQVPQALKDDLGKIRFDLGTGAITVEAVLAQ